MSNKNEHINKKYKKITVYLPESDGGKVAKLAKKTGLSQNAYVRTLIYKDLEENAA